MILQQSIDSAYPLAEGLANAGITLAPVAETPLSTLIASMYSTALDSNSVKGVECGSYPQEIMAASVAQNQQGIVLHDITVDEIVPVVVACVQNGINVARNVVNPIIQAVVTDVNNSVTDLEAQAGTLLGVAPVFYKDTWGNAALAGMVERYSEVAASELVPAIEIPLQPNVNFEELVKTPSTSLNSNLKAWLDTVGVEHLTNLHQYAFGNSMQRLTSFRAFTNVNECDIDDLLFIHLVARNYFDNAPSGVDSTLGDLRVYLGKVIEQTGLAVYRVLDKREAENRRKTLIRRWPSTRLEYMSVGEGVIQVNGEVYNRWLAEGGTPEILFGSFITDKVGDYQTLLTNGAEYTKAWERQARVLQTKARFNRFNNIVTAFKLALAKQINAVSDDAIVVPRETMHQRAAELLLDVTQSKTDNLYLLSRQLVCSIMFSHTDAELILEAVDAAARDNPALDIREAALLATIEVVGLWISEMTIIRK